MTNNMYCCEDMKEHIEKYLSNVGENSMGEIFYNDDILVNYEKQEEWDKSVEYLNELVDAQPFHKSTLYRFAALNWYVLTDWDYCMPKDRLDRSLFELGLEKAYRLAKEKWWDDSHCLWLFGYFMYINPIDFTFFSDDIQEVIKQGDSLITKAYCDDPNNQLAEILYLCDHGSKRKYKEVKKKYKEDIAVYFPGQSGVEQYFIEIFTKSL